MSYFYSEQITYCECIMPRQIGWQVVNELGQLEYIHFDNTQINYDNHYCKSLKRCDQAIGKLNEINNFITSINPKFKLQHNGTYRDLLGEYRKEIEDKNIHGYLYINEIEDEINAIHDYLWRQKKELDHLDRELQDKLVDLALIVTLLGSEDFTTITRQKDLVNSASIFDFKCLMINRKDIVALEKGIFRISRGHSWVKTLQLDRVLMQTLTPKQQALLADKMVCIIIFGESNTLLNKINRFLACLQTDTKHINSTTSKWQENIKSLKAQIKQIKNIEHLTNDAVQRYLYKLYEPYAHSRFSLLAYLEGYALKEREIYRKLAAMVESKNFLHFSIFIPKKQLPLKLSLNEKLPPLTLTPKQSPKQPPTKFTSFALLEIPQEILNTYGIPNYGQFNPAVLYIVTFAFFIGVMFGDVGHMLMAIPYVLYFKFNAWVWIVLFFMGYCGLIYNQFFGLNFGLFSSCYAIPPYVVGSDVPTRAARIPDCVYPLGIDSIWKVAENKMQFTNSFKMKLAVILGVIHMLLGLGIKIINTVKKNNYLSLFTVAIPQLIFMLCTFFYMDFLIVLKWNTDYTGKANQYAPSIINTMIEAYAGFGGSDLRFWEGERRVERFLMVVGYSMIPIMLLGVPLGTYISRRKGLVGPPDNEAEHLQFHDLVNEKVDADNGNGSEEALSDRSRPSNHKGILAHESQPMGEIFVHSFIETIEYVLGAVSNTASYLRLWALSLAHGQLSQVIFTLILQPVMGGGYGKIVLALFAFLCYYSVTFGVLICMDSMECFLHALRLHWVEFQNKFYQGKGYKFEPFHFRAINTHRPLTS